MSRKSLGSFRDLTADELSAVSGGKAEAEAPPIQGGGLPKPVILPRPIVSGKPPEAPLPIFNDLP